MARTLDLLGERWTLLVVRDLLLGPQRFTDLVDGMPGVPRNLLAARLRLLEDMDLLERRDLPPPAASRVYELTEAGRALAPAINELARWGIEHLGDPQAEVFVQPVWVITSMCYTADPVASRGLHETYQFNVEGKLFHLLVDDGSIETRSGPAHEPELVITVDEKTLIEIFKGEADPVEVAQSGRVSFEGSPEAVGNLMTIVASSQGR